MNHGRNCNCFNYTELYIKKRAVVWYSVKAKVVPVAVNRRRVCKMDVLIVLH